MDDINGDGGPYLVPVELPEGVEWLDSYDTLGRYNAERNRGLVHTPEWVERMGYVQARFDAERRQELLDQGYRELEGGGMWMRLDGGQLDLGVIRDRDLAWGGSWRWWKRWVPRRWRERFGYLPLDWTGMGWEDGPTDG